MTPGETHPLRARLYLEGLVGGCTRSEPGMGFVATLQMAFRTVKVQA